jgi:hypothetical protein
MFAENIENFNNNNVILMYAIKNSMIEHSLFYKFLYSNDFITFNGIFLHFQLENISFNKDRIILTKNNENNKNVLNNIINVENKLFNIINSNKIKNYKLSELINNNNIKFSKSDIDNINDFNECNECIECNECNKHHFILKLSGFWETNENIGITFKIIKINKFLDLKF